MRFLGFCCLIVSFALVAAGCDDSSSAPKKESLPPDLQEQAAPATAPAAAPASAPATQALAKPINQFCAVEHDDKVDPKVTTTYQGKLIGFCCEDCIPKFNKEPEKYMASLK